MWRIRRLTLMLAVLALTASLAACTGDDPRTHPRTLPPLTPSATPSASPTPTPANTAGLSDKQQVRAIYEGLVRNFGDTDGMTRAERRRFYRHWAIDPALRSYASGDGRKRGQKATGHSVPHIVKIDLKTHTAIVYDCSDDSGVVVRDTNSGKVISRGRSHVRTFASLRKTALGWRVFDSDAQEGSCKRTLS